MGGKTYYIEDEKKSGWGAARTWAASNRGSQSGIGTGGFGGLGNTLLGAGVKVSVSDPNFRNGEPLDMFDSRVGTARSPEAFEAEIRPVLQAIKDGVKVAPPEISQWTVVKRILDLNI